MDTSKYFVALLGNNHPSTIIRKTKETILATGSAKLVEIYRTPFDAISALNKSVRIAPEYDVTVYQTNVSNDNIIHIIINNKTYTFSTVDLEFEKVQVLVLGGIAKYL